MHLVLKDDETVESVVAEFRAALAPGAIIVDHTTTQPALTAERAVRLNAEGVRYIHCPVFIGPAMIAPGASAARNSTPTLSTVASSFEHQVHAIGALHRVSRRRRPRAPEASSAVAFAAVRFQTATESPRPSAASTKPAPRRPVPRKAMWAVMVWPWV